MVVGSHEALLDETVDELQYYRAGQKKEPLGHLVLAEMFPKWTKRLDNDLSPLGSRVQLTSSTRYIGSWKAYHSSSCFPGRPEYKQSLYTSPLFDDVAYLYYGPGYREGLPALQDA